MRNQKRLPKLRCLIDYAHIKETSRYYLQAEMQDILPPYQKGEVFAGQPTYNKQDDGVPKITVEPAEDDLERRLFGRPKEPVGLTDTQLKQVKEIVAMLDSDLRSEIKGELEQARQARQDARDLETVHEHQEADYKLVSTDEGYEFHHEGHPKKAQTDIAGAIDKLAREYIWEEDIDTLAKSNLKHFLAWVTSILKENEGEKE